MGSIWDKIPKGRDPLMGEDYDLDPSAGDWFWGENPPLDAHRDSPIVPPGVGPGLLNPVDAIAGLGAAKVAGKAGPAIADGAAALGRETQSVWTHLPQVLGDETGAIKPGIVFDQFKRLLEGENPLDMSLKEYGKHVQEVGGDRRNFLGSLMGAQAADEYGSIDPKKVYESHLLSRGIPSSEQPKLILQGQGPYLGGSTAADASATQLEGYPDLVPSPQHPNLASAGTAKHEAWHAGQIIQNPKADLLNISHPERFLPAQMTNKNLGTVYNLETMLRHAKQNPDQVQFSPWVAGMLNRGESPAELAKYLINDNQTKSEMGKIIRGAAGNSGFKGNNPYLTDVLQSDRHFGSPGMTDYVKGEMEIPILELGRQQADLGGEINPDILKRFPELAERQNAYKSAIRPMKLPSQETVLDGALPNAGSPWAAIGGLTAGAGLGASIPYGLSNFEANHPSEPKTDNLKDQELEPHSSDDESSYPTEALLNLIRKAHSAAYPAKR